jgi:hypothetical protein
MAVSRGDPNLPALAAPARRALAAAGYTRLEQLTAITARDLLKLHGMGPNALEQLRRALADRQLSFADET